MPKLALDTGHPLYANLVFAAGFDEDAGNFEEHVLGTLIGVIEGTGGGRGTDATYGDTYAGALDGDARVNFGDNAAWDGLADVTIAILAKNNKADIAATGTEYFAFNEGSGLDSFSCYQQQNENFGLSIGHAGGNTVATISGAFLTVAPNQWNLVGGSRNGTTGEVIARVGKTLSQTQAGGTGNQNATAHDLLIGGDAGNGSYDGDIAAIYIFNKVLSQVEWDALADAAIGPFEGNTPNSVTSQGDATFEFGETQTLDLVGFAAVTAVQLLNGTDTPAIAFANYAGDDSAATVDVTMALRDLFADGAAHQHTMLDTAYDLRVFNGGISEDLSIQVVQSAVADTDSFLRTLTGVGGALAPTGAQVGGSLLVEVDTGVMYDVSTTSYPNWDGTQDLSGWVNATDPNASPAPKWLVPDTFSFTANAEESPDPFSFTDQSGLEPSTADVTSDLVTVSGLTGQVSAAISGDATAEYSKNGGAYTNAAGVANNGDTFRVRVDTGAGYLTPHNATLAIGGGSDTFTATNRAEDTTPDAFSFADQTALPSTADVESGAVTLAGYDSANDATFTGDTGSMEMSVNAGAWQAVATVSLAPGDTLNLRGDAPAVDGDDIAVTMTLLGVADTYTLTASLAVPLLSDPPYNVDVRPINNIKTDLSESGAIRGVDLGQQNAYSLNVTYPLLTSAEVDLVMAHYDANRNGKIIVEPVLDSFDYVAPYVNEPERRTTESLLVNVTIRFEGNRKV